MKKYVLLCAIVMLALMAMSNFAGAVGEAPAVGSMAPEFTMTTNEGKPASLKDFRGQWVVLYFYPKDFTSGCTIEAKNFQRDIEKYKASNAVILGVSVDTAESHKEFCAKEGLNFKLLSDVDGKARRLRSPRRRRARAVEQHRHPAPGHAGRLGPRAGARLRRY